MASSHISNFVAHVLVLRRQTGPQARRFFFFLFPERAIINFISESNHELNSFPKLVWPMPRNEQGQLKGQKQDGVCQGGFNPSFCVS